jgi:hypothetical protein
MDRVAGNKIPGPTGRKWMIFQGAETDWTSQEQRETGAAAPMVAVQSSSGAQREPGSIPKMVAKSWTTVLFISANAAINPIVKEKMVRPSSKLSAPDWSVTKRQIKPFIAQVLPDDKAKPPG